MSRHLPPLTALRAFEAAGRHLSFTRAAAELAVTQAAISHQIKALEEHLGVTLFNRRPRRLTLTDAGQELLLAMSQSFDDIAGHALSCKEDCYSHFQAASGVGPFGSVSKKRL